MRGNYAKFNRAYLCIWTMWRARLSSGKPAHRAASAAKAAGRELCTGRDPCLAAPASGLAGSWSASVSGLLSHGLFPTTRLDTTRNMQVARPRQFKAAGRTRAHLLAPARTLPTGAGWLAGWLAGWQAGRQGGRGVGGGAAALHSEPTTTRLTHEMI
jgi:hypothetical protein